MGDNSDQVIRYYFDKDQDHSFNKIKKVKVATQMLYFIIKNMNNEEKKTYINKLAGTNFKWENIEFYYNTIKNDIDVKVNE